MDKCTICEAPAQNLFCDTCARAYDRWLKSRTNDGTIDAMIRWVSRRTRRIVLSAMHLRRSRQRRHDA